MHCDVTNTNTIVSASAMTQPNLQTINVAKCCAKINNKSSQNGLEIRLFLAKFIASLLAPFSI